LSFSAGCPSTICDLLLGLRSLIYKCFALLDPSEYSSRLGALLHMLADDFSRRDHMFGCMHVVAPGEQSPD
ncbi:unnamed protein product, partial [Amoebophrya sp. A25]